MCVMEACRVLTSLINLPRSVGTFHPFFYNEQGPMDTIYLWLWVPASAETPAQPHCLRTKYSVSVHVPSVVTVWAVGPPRPVSSEEQLAAASCLSGGRGGGGGGVLVGKGFGFLRLLSKPHRLPALYGIKGCFSLFLGCCLLLGAGLFWVFCFVFAFFGSSWFGLALSDRVLLSSLPGFRPTGLLVQPPKG